MLFRSLDLGHTVLVLDDLSTGSIDNIAHLKAAKRFSYVVDSVRSEPLLAEMIDRSDIVFHLAAVVGVKLIVEQPVHPIETNAPQIRTASATASDYTPVPPPFPNTSWYENPVDSWHSRATFSTR